MYSNRDDYVLGTGSQGMTKPTSSCEGPARTAGAVCVGGGGTWDEGLAAFAATRWLVGAGVIPAGLLVVQGTAVVWGSSCSALAW